MPFHHFVDSTPPLFSPLESVPTNPVSAVKAAGTEEGAITDLERGAAAGVINSTMSFLCAASQWSTVVIQLHVTKYLHNHYLHKYYRNTTESR